MSKFNQRQFKQTKVCWWWSCDLLTLKDNLVSFQPSKFPINVAFCLLWSPVRTSECFVQLASTFSSSWFCGCVVSRMTALIAAQLFSNSPRFNRSDSLSVLCRAVHATSFLFVVCLPAFFVSLQFDLAPYLCTPVQMDVIIVQVIICHHRKSKFRWNILNLGIVRLFLSDKIYLLIWQF